MNGAGPVLIAAGGTGGHLFPAEALSNELAARGIRVELVTDERAAKYGAAFPARAIHKLASATPSSGTLYSRALAIFRLALATWRARQLIRRIRPCAVVGFGGYPTVPPVLAAAQLGAPTILHEGNAVIGRANRFLAPRVDAIAKGFETLGGVSGKIAAKARLTGNPVRPAAREAAKTAYPDGADGKLRLLITGGSQGAKILSDVVPTAIAHMPEEERDKLIITQQARGEDEARVRQAYARLGVAAEISPFFTDLPQRIAAAHLVIGRAGASTISELGVIGRPAILVPLPHALDQDQAANARQFAARGAAIIIPQSEFSPQRLAKTLSEALGDREGLALRAQAAKAMGVADAAERLADLVLSVAARMEKPQ